PASPPSSGRRRDAAACRGRGCGRRGACSCPGNDIRTPQIEQCRLWESKANRVPIRFPADKMRSSHTPQVEKPDGSEDMKRRPQVDSGDWHVTARGARRMFLFHDDADFKVFYAILGP